MEEGAVAVYLNTKYWKVKFYRHLICPVFSNKGTKWIYLKQCYLGENIYLAGSLQVRWYGAGTARYCLKRRWRETPALFKCCPKSERGGGSKQCWVPAGRAPSEVAFSAETASVAAFCLGVLRICLLFFGF